jgi:hypothetical protein
MLLLRRHFEGVVGPDREATGLTLEGQPVRAGAGSGIVIQSPPGATIRPEPSRCAARQRRRCPQGTTGHRAGSGRSRRPSGRRPGSWPFPRPPPSSTTVAGSAPAPPWFPQEPSQPAQLVSVVARLLMLITSGSIERPAGERLVALWSRRRRYRDRRRAACQSLPGLERLRRRCRRFLRWREDRRWT